MITVPKEECPSFNFILQIKENWTHLAEKNLQPGVMINTILRLS